MTRREGARRPLWLPGVVVAAVSLVVLVFDAGLAAAANPAELIDGVVQQVVVEKGDGSWSHLTTVSTPWLTRTVTGLDGVPSGSRIRAKLSAASVDGRRSVRRYALVPVPVRPIPEPTATEAPAQPVVVVPVQWAGHPVDRTAAVVGNVVTGQVNSYWREASNGQIGFRISKALAPVTLSASVCSNMGAALTKAYQAAGTAGQQAGAHLLMYFASASDCAFAGMATVSNHNPGAGGWLMVNGLARLDVIGHELGHNEGLGHSSLNWCTSGGVRNSDGPGCVRRDYADPYDVMGIAWNTTGNLSAVQRDALNLMPAGSITTMSGSGVATLAPLGGTSGLRAVRFVDGTAHYWIEYRTAVGRDSWIDGSPATSWYAVPGSGIVIHRADQLGAGMDTLLVDTSPSGGSLGSAALTVGQSWTSASGHLRLDVTGATTSEADVTVTRS